MGLSGTIFMHWNFLGIDSNKSTKWIVLLPEVCCISFSFNSLCNPKSMSWLDIQVSLKDMEAKLHPQNQQLVKTAMRSRRH